MRQAWPVLPFPRKRGVHPGSVLLISGASAIKGRARPRKPPGFPPYHLSVADPPDGLPRITPISRRLLRSAEATRLNPQWAGETSLDPVTALVCFQRTAAGDRLAAELLIRAPKSNQIRAGIPVQARAPKSSHIHAPFVRCAGSGNPEALFNTPCRSEPELPGLHCIRSANAASLPATSRRGTHCCVVRRSRHERQMRFFKTRTRFLPAFSQSSPGSWRSA